MDYSIKVSLDSTDIAKGELALDRWQAAGVRASFTAEQLQRQAQLTSVMLGTRLAATTAVSATQMGELGKKSATTETSMDRLSQSYTLQARALGGVVPQITKVTGLLDQAATAAKSAATAPRPVDNTAALLREAQARHAVTVAALEEASARAKAAFASRQSATGADVAVTQRALVNARREQEAADRASTVTALALLKAEEAVAAQQRNVATSSAAVATGATQATTALAGEAAAAKTLAKELENVKKFSYPPPPNNLTGRLPGLPTERREPTLPKGTFDAEKLFGNAGPKAPDPQIAAGIDRQIQALQRQAAVLGMSARQAKLHELAIAGATPAQLRLADAALKSSEAFERTAARQKATLATVTAVARTAALAIAGIGTAATAAQVAVNKLTESAGSFQDLEDQTGGSAEGFASMKTAAEVAGVSIEQIALSTNRLNTRLAQVSDEGKGAAAALRSIGIDVKTFRDLKADEQFRLIAEALDKYADGGEKAAIASQLLGIGGARQLKVFKELAQEQEKGIKLTQAQIQEADRISDANRRLSSQLTKVAQIAALEAAPAMLELRKTLVDVAADFLGVDKATGKLRDANAVREFAQTAAVALASLLDIANKLVSAFRLLVTGAQLADLKARQALQSAASGEKDGELPLPLRGAVKGLRALGGVSPLVPDAVRDQLKTPVDPRRVQELQGRFDRELMKSSNGEVLSAASALRASFDRQNQERERQEREDARPNAFTDPRSLLAGQKPRDLSQDAGKPKIKVPSPASDKAANEARQVEQAQLQADLKFLQDLLSQQRDALRFHNQQLDLLYSDGTISLVQQLDERKKAQAKALQDELNLLTDEQARLEVALKSPLLTKDPSEALKLRNQLAEVTARADRVATEGAREAALAEMQRAAALRQSAQQAEQLRAGLLELQGDFRGAASIRINQEQAQDRVTLRQTAEGPITPEVEASIERQLALRRKLREELAAFQIAQQETSQIIQRASIDEERALMRSIAQRKSLFDEERDIAGIRQQAVQELETRVAELQRIASLPENQLNVQLRIQAEQAVLDLEKARQDMDPSLVRLREAARSTGDGIAEAIGGAVRNFEGFKPLLKQIGDEIANFTTKILVVDPIKKQLQDFAGELATGDSFIGRFFKDAVGAGKPATAAAQRPVVDTTQVQQSLNNLQTTAVEPARVSLGNFSLAVDAASQRLSTFGGGVPANAPIFAPGASPTAASQIQTPGDFARFDRALDAAREAAQSAPTRTEPVPVEIQPSSQLPSPQSLGLGPGIIDSRSTGQQIGDIALEAGASSIGGPAGLLLNLLRPAPRSPAQAQTPTQPALGETTVTQEVMKTFQTGVEAANDALGALPDQLGGLGKGLADLLSSMADGLGDLFSGIGSGAGGAGGLFSGIASLFGFERGGFTGEGGSQEPAGVVHKGEFVFSAPATKKIGKAALNAMHKQARAGASMSMLGGFANGGFAEGGGLTQGSTNIYDLRGLKVDSHGQMDHMSEERSAQRIVRLAQSMTSRRSA